MDNFGMTTELLLTLKVVIGEVQTAELEIEDDSVPAALYYTIVKVIGQNLDISILSEQGVVSMLSA